MSEEMVLVFPTDALIEFPHGHFQGVLGRPAADCVFDRLLREENLSFMSRAEAESDPTHKQVIPYCVLREGGKFFLYKRTRKGGEGRLHDRYAIGVGGHVNPPCHFREFDLLAGEGYSTYFDGLLRELKEEVGLDLHVAEVSPSGLHFFSQTTLLGLVNDDSDPVGRVHFGVVHLIDVPAGQEVRCTDPALADGAFLGPGELREKLPSLEGWSKLVVEKLLSLG